MHPSTTGMTAGSVSGLVAIETVLVDVAFRLVPFCSRRYRWTSDENTW